MCLLIDFNNQTNKQCAEFTATEHTPLVYFIMNVWYTDNYEDAMDIQLPNMDNFHLSNTIEVPSRRVCVRIYV
jgi:hypothetical protein